jgi:2-polyprenyl-6-methoxyphenol hydroxylase-like FAD-dependent oxidoreductase
MGIEPGMQPDTQTGVQHEHHASAEQRPRALVIGGSVGGLFAAHLLRRIGWDAVVYERTGHDLAGRGAGIGTSDALFAVLQRIGVAIGAPDGVELRARIGLDRGGAVTHELPALAVATSWDSIYRALRQALPSEIYRPGMLLTHVEQDASGVSAIFADGSRATGDLLIGADGFASTVRRSLFPDVQPQYAGYVCWRGVAEDHDLPPEAHALLDHRFAFGLPPGEVALALHIPGPGGDTHGGRHRHYLAWYRPADPERTLPDLCTDATGHRHGVSIPPPLIRPDVVADLKASAAALLAPQAAAIIEHTAQPLLQAIFDVEAPRLVVGRAVLIGDAAFVARPHIASGVTKAALDAQSLADALVGAPDDLLAALARYEADRLPAGRELVARGRWLGDALIGRPDARDDATLAHRSEIMLQEYGASPTSASQPIT